jgi:hypothetical protein
MKTALIVFTLNIFIGFIVISLLHSNLKINFTELSLSTGKEPGPDQRPDEWAYIKKTYPYYNADSDVYIKAIEQAINLKSRNYC